MDDAGFDRLLYICVDAQNALAPVKLERLVYVIF